MALPQINHKQYKQLLNIVMQSGHPLLVVGKPGIGKTVAAKQFCIDNNIDLIISHPATDAPQDIKGYPAKSTMQVKQNIDLDDLLAGLDEGKEQLDETIDIATFLPFGQMLQVLTTLKPTIWFFDDFGQAPASVQAALMQLIGDRELCGKKLPDCVKIIACTNGKEHKANVQGLLEPIKSRFGMIVELMEDLPGFRQFAIDTAMYQSIPLFLEYQPAALCDFKTDKGMENSPNPRLWKKLSDQLYALDATVGKDDALREIVICGAIGTAWGRQFAAFERIQSKLPDYMDIVSEWEDYPINQPLDVRIAMLGMLAAKGQPKHSKQIFSYTGKMAKEYQVVFFRLVRAYNPELLNSDYAQRWWASNMDIYID